jgi:hypothetical protein
MSTKPYELSQDDPVVEQFNSGLEAWERPFEAPETTSSIRTRGAAKAGRGVRARGAVKTRGGKPHAAGKQPPEALPEDDPVVEQFKDGLADWEHPFE